MRKILFLLVLVLFACFTGATQVIPIDHTINVDFQSSTSFRLVFDGGFEKFFSWNTNQTASDSTFTYRYYHTIDEHSFCNQYTSCNEYQNISTKLSDMLLICGNIVQTWNSSDNYRQETTEAIKDRDTYELMFENCKYDLDNIQNKTSEYKSDMIMYRDELDICEGDLTRAEKSTGEYSECSSDLDQALSDKNTFGLGGLFTGIIAGYLLWKRKPSIGPSEHAEAGVVSDRPSSSYFNDMPRD